jgi:hypothetical protein
MLATLARNRKRMSEHPPATPAIGAMAEGLRFQLRHFWLHALPMLYLQRPRRC